MPSKKQIIGSSILLLFLFPLLINSQIKLNINFESGLYSDLANTLNDKTSLITRVFGNAKYKYYDENTESAASLKLGSDYFTNHLHSIRFKSNGSYIYHQENVVWKSSINYDYITHSSNEIATDINVFSIIAGAEYYLWQDFPLNILFGYSYQNIVSENEINSDFIFADISSLNSLSNYLNISYGLFAQNYITKSNFNYSDNHQDSKGIKYGPQVAVNYLKSFLFNFEYKFLLYSSNQTKYPSFEHQIKILAGVIIKKKLSVFLLADLLIRKIKFKNSDSAINPNLFLPIKNENQISLKSSLLISTSLRPYIKIGFYNEDLVSGSRQLKGLNFLGGIEIKL